jgi:hypothetical protein
MDLVELDQVEPELVGLGPVAPELVEKDQAELDLAAMDWLKNAIGLAHGIQALIKWSFSNPATS